MPSLNLDKIYAEDVGGTDLIVRDGGGATRNILNRGFNPLDLAPDGVNDFRAAFVAVEAEGDSGLAPSGIYRISSNLTLSKAWRFEKGAILKPDAGVAITIGGEFAGSLSQHFDISAGGTVTFSRAPEMIFPEWWGAPGNNVDDDLPALRAARDSMGIGTTVRLPSRPYYVSDTFYTGSSRAILGDNYARANGGGPTITRLSSAVASWADGKAIVALRNEDGSEATECKLSGIKIAGSINYFTDTGSTTGPVGLDVGRVKNSILVENVEIERCRTALSAKSPDNRWLYKFDHLSITKCRECFDFTANKALFIDLQCRQNYSMGTLVGNAIEFISPEIENEAQTSTLKISGTQITVVGGWMEGNLWHYEIVGNVTLALIGTHYGGTEGPDTNNGFIKINDGVTEANITLVGTYLDGNSMGYLYRKSGSPTGVSILHSNVRYEGVVTRFVGDGTVNQDPRNEKLTIAGITFVEPAKGRVRQTHPPGFLATRSTKVNDVLGNSALYTFRPDTVVYTDGGYDPNTGIYTAPLAGRYMVDPSVYLREVAAAHTWLSIDIVSSNRTYRALIVNPGAMHSTGHFRLPAPALVDMETGDTLSIVVQIVGGTQVVDVDVASHLAVSLVA